MLNSGRPELGIIIVNYNSFENTIKCVDSILDSMTKCKYSIYIVNNGSTNNSLSHLTAYYSSNRIVNILDTKNNGYSAGLNVGILQAQSDGCEFFLLCNNDLLFQEGTIDALINMNKNSPHIGVIGGMIVGNDGKQQKSYKQIMTFREHLSEKKPYHWFLKSKYSPMPNNKITTFYGMVSGACFLLSNRTIKKIGYLDSKIFLFYEEDALAYMLKKANLQAMYVPSIKIIHFGSTTIGTNGTTYYLNRYKSSMYVLKKYAKINNLKLWLVYLSNIISLKQKSILNKDFKKAEIELQNWYKRLKAENYD